MKYLAIALTFVSLSAQALPHMSTKERVRLEMWVEGIETHQPEQAAPSVKAKTVPLPEEITVILNKLRL